MKEEIKEIISYFRKYATIRENAMLTEIEDCITNLQQEIENLKDFNNKLQATKDRLDKYDRENQLKIDKAISMLKELNIKLKDILKIGIGIKEISDIEEVLKGK